MANIDDLRTLAQQIKNETNVGANTANRVGTTFEKTVTELEAHATAVAAEATARQQADTALQEQVLKSAINVSSLVSKFSILSSHFWITNSSTWYAEDTYKTCFVNIKNAKTLKIITGNNVSVIAFLKTLPTQSGGAVDFSDTIGHVIVRANSDYETIIPNDAEYIWLTLEGNNTSYKPDSLLIDGVEYVYDDIIKKLQNVNNKDIIIDSILAPYQERYFVSSSGSFLKSSSSLIGSIRFRAKKGVTYFIQGQAVASESFLAKYKNGIYTNIITGTGSNNSISYTPTEDCVLIVSLYDSASTYSIKCCHNVFDEVNPSDIEVIVDKNGGYEFTKLVDAVEYANAFVGLSTDNKCVIRIKEGIYDLYTELGGDAWRNTIVHSGTFSERQGVRLDNNVDLIGDGNVELRLELPDTSTYEQSQCVSTLNLYRSNNLYGLHIYAKNCRYAIHDESNGDNFKIQRHVENCYLEHLGNVDGLWTSKTAMGGGASGDSRYEWINCQFVTNGFWQAFSYHTNNNAKPSYFNIDGCVGYCKNYTGSQTMRSFCAQYFGTNHVGKTIFNFKCCTGNGEVIKRAQTQDSEDHIEVYVNGYNQVDTFDGIPKTQK